MNLKNINFTKITFDPERNKHLSPQDRMMIQDMIKNRDESFDEVLKAAKLALDKMNNGMFAILSVAVQGKVIFTETKLEVISNEAIN